MSGLAESAIVNKVRAAVEASRVLALAGSARIDQALEAMALALEDSSAMILQANAQDVAMAEACGTSEAMLDRLRLTESRIAGMVAGIRMVKASPSPLGESQGWVRPNGLSIRRIRVPLGVVAMVYEARPNVTTDSAALALKAGNACVLRGSASALHSNTILSSLLRRALATSGLPEDAIVFIDDASHSSVEELARLNGLIDVMIPRGGHGLISRVVEVATVPVLQTGVGNCHLYVHRAADLQMAVRILLNGKVSRPAVCNALEKLLVDADIAREFLPQAARALWAKKVEIRACPQSLAILSDLYPSSLISDTAKTQTNYSKNVNNVNILGENTSTVLDFCQPCRDKDESELQSSAGATYTEHPLLIPAEDSDWDTEYTDLKIAVKVVANIDEAIAHITAHTTGHSECIVTADYEASKRFGREIDACAVYTNASTRFTDGGEFGFGAEIGISTQKLHARGPLGLRELTTTKYLIDGDGQIR